MKIFLIVSSIAAYILIGYLFYIFIIKPKDEIIQDLFEDDILACVLLWPIFIVTILIFIIVYYIRILFAKLYIGVFKRK